MRDRQGRKTYGHHRRDDEGSRERWLTERASVEDICRRDFPPSIVESG
jgi:hypothetical protein